MAVCQHCGAQTIAARPFCTSCGRPSSTEAGAAAHHLELDRVSYVIEQAPMWAERGWVPRWSARRLVAELIERRHGLWAELGIDAPAEQSAAGRGVPSAARAAEGADPAQAAPGGSDGPPAPPAGAERLASFVEAHWQKLLAALAALLILAGLRQIVGSVAFGLLTAALTPLLPAVLGAGLYLAGRRAAAPGSLHSFACRAIGVSLAALAVASANRHWLGDLLAGPPAWLLGALTAAWLADLERRRSSDERFWHVATGLGLAGGYAALQALWPTAPLDPRPVAAYAGAPLAAAAVLLAAAVAARRRGNLRAALHREVWAHACAAFALLNGGMGASAGGQAAAVGAALLVIAAAIYAAGAHGLGQTGLVRLAGLGGAAAAPLALWTLGRVEAVDFGLGAATLWAGALGLAAAYGAAARRAGGLPRSDALGLAYGELAVAFSAASALALAAAFLLPPDARWAATPGPDWPRGVVLASACAALAAAQAARRREPAWHWFASAATLAATWPLTARFAPPWVAAAALAPWPYAACALPVGLALRRRGEAWAAPWLVGSLTAAIGSGAVSMAVGDGRAAWASRLLWLALLWVGAFALRTHPWAGLGRAWMAAAALLAALCAALTAGTALGLERHAAAAAAFVAMGMLWSGVASRPGLVEAAPAWPGALRGVARACAAAAIGVLLAGPHPAAAPAIAWFVAVALGSAALWLAEARPGMPWPGLAGACLTVLMAGLHLMSLPWPGSDPVPGATAVALAGAALLAGASRRARCPAGLWTASGALMLAGAAGLEGATAARLALPSVLVGAALLASLLPWGRRHALGSSAVALLAGWTLAIAGRDAWGQVAHAAMAALAAGVCGALYACFAAHSDAEPSTARLAGALSGLALSGGWAALVIEGAGLPDIHWCVAALVAAAALRLGAERWRGAGHAGAADGWSATSRGILILAAAWSATFALDDEAASVQAGWLAATATLGLLGGWMLRDRWWLGTGAHAATAALWAAAARVAGWPEGDCALVLAMAAAAWVGAARLAEIARTAGDPHEPLYGHAGVAVWVSAAAALLAVGQLGQGEPSLVALLTAGGASAAMRLCGRGAGWRHVAFALVFTAYLLAVYDTFGLGISVADLYLMPTGLYIVYLGHQAARRGAMDQAQTLWWVGLLTALTPAFAAFYFQHQAGAGGARSLLLLAECSAAIAWGVVARVRAYVLAGMVYAAGCALVLGAGRIGDPWSAAGAVVVGLALLTFLRLASTREGALRGWVDRMGEEWRGWR
ncbi:MAG: hypothetical protein IT208_07780 [Chthonomonadales bacterium]|nr:hypothetical protein [Chthonomonadales bacterium]